MNADCQDENDQFELSYADLPRTLQYAIARCVDKVRDGVNLPREVVEGWDCYSYRVGDKISRGCNSPQGLNIFRDQIEG